MDPQPLLALPQLSRRAGRTWRIQRQVHVQPIRFAWRFLRHLTQPYSPDLSQFLPAGKTLAVYRHQTRPRSSVRWEDATAEHAPNDNAIMNADQLTAIQPASAVPPATSDL